MSKYQKYLVKNPERPKRKKQTRNTMMSNFFDKKTFDKPAKLFKQNNRRKTNLAIEFTDCTSPWSWKTKASTTWKKAGNSTSNAKSYLDHAQRKFILQPWSLEIANASDLMSPIWVKLKTILETTVVYSIWFLLKLIVLYPVQPRWEVVQNKRTDILMVRVSICDLDKILKRLLISLDQDNFIQSIQIWHQWTLLTRTEGRLRTGARTPLGLVDSRSRKKEYRPTFQAPLRIKPTRTGC